MPTIYGAVDLVKNELRNCVVQNLGSAPSSPVKGLLYFDSTANILYWYNGSGWVAAQGGAGAVPATTVTTQAIGDAPVVGVATTYAREDHKHGEPSFGNVTAQTTFGGASSNGAAVSVPRSDHTHGTPTHDAAAHSAISVSSLAAPTGDYSMNGFRVLSVGTPTGGTDAANKNYVDGAINGLAWKDTVKFATTANIALTGNVSIDGGTTGTGDRVLVKNQTTLSENGIYVAAAGAWARAADADSEQDILSAAVFCYQGTVNADTAWVCTTNVPITIGATAIQWAQFGAGAVYTAGNGLTLTANSFDVGAGTGITVAADTVAVDTTVIATQTYVTTAITGMAKKYAAALTGTASPETVTHNLGTRDIWLSVYNGATPYTAVQVDWDATTTTTAVIRYNPNLGAGYRVVVLG